MFFVIYVIVYNSTIMFVFIVDGLFTIIISIIIMVITVSVVVVIITIIICIM